MADTRDVTSQSLELFLAEVVDLTLDGWKIHPSNKGDVFVGLAFSCTMYRDENTVEAFRQASVGIEAKPKLTRAEILAKARAVANANRIAKLTPEEILEA